MLWVWKSWWQVNWKKIFEFQPLTKDQPLVIVVQTPQQKALLQENPHPMVFMDASYKGLTSYGYALYALVLVNQTGRGVPFAYLIMSQESSAIVELCLNMLCSRNPNFYPRWEHFFSKVQYPYKHKGVVILRDNWIPFVTLTMFNLLHLPRWNCDTPVFCNIIIWSLDLFFLGQLWSTET